MNVWVVRSSFGKFADAYRDGGYMAVNWSISEPYPVGAGRDAYIDQYKRYYPEQKSNVVIGNHVGQIIRFCEDIQPGDYVITPSKNSDVLYYGKVRDELYRYDENPKDKDLCPIPHRRNVDWSKKTVSRSSFSVPFQNTSRAMLTVFSISQSAEFLAAVGAEGYEPPEAVPVYNHYDGVLGQILTLDDQEFEFLVKELLHAIGFEETERTGKSGDGGVDVTGILNVSSVAEVRVYVQAKRYKSNKINVSDVRHLRAAIPAGGQGTFITTTDYRPKAYDIATEAGFPRIGLINGRQLVDLLVEHWHDIPEEFQDKLGLKVGLVLSS